MDPVPPADKSVRRGGLAQYFVEHREVGWLILVAVLLWGWVSYRSLPQQEDPKIPIRIALLETQFPGANALKLEQLVTKKLEEKIGELESVEEITSQSRSGVSVITIKQRPNRKARIEQEWDKLRAKLREVVLPEGCAEPSLDTDYGNTTTLLFALTSPSASEAETIARANLIRARLAASRSVCGSQGRAAVFAFFPPAVAESYRTVVRQKFVAMLAHEQIGDDINTIQGKSFLLADFKTAYNAEQLKQFVSRFTRELVGTEGERHPDFGTPMVLVGAEDPLPLLRADTHPRYSYRELEINAKLLEDELKQVESVGRIRKIGNVSEEVALLFSIPVLNGFNFSADEVLNAIASRNAIIPGGTFRAKGQNFPVQLSGEFENEDAMLSTIVNVTRNGAPVYLRDLLEVRRGYQTPIPYSVEVLHRAHKGGALEAARSVLLAVEMKEGKIISQFNDAVHAAINQARARLPEGVQVLALSDQPKAVVQRIRHLMCCFIEAMVIVVLVALFLMNWRSALVVAMAIPLTLAMTFGGMGLLDVPLHQISIASLIIALGMLVDDPVVASDGINRELAQGQPRDRAAWLGPYKLRRAIMFGTIINIVAFLPLALLPGDKGAFIIALPIVVTLALVSSRIVSMTFVPLLAYYLLRGQKGLEYGGEVRSFILFKPVDQLLVATLPRYQRLLLSALNRPGRSVLIAYGLLMASFGLTIFFGQQFFPPAERNQMLIDIELPESASLLQTRGVCQQVSSLLKHHDEITSAAIFSGGSAPRFYYNVVPRQPANYLAQVVINTRRAADVPPLIVKLRAALDREIAGARCVVKQLEQGPPVESPIQIRLTGGNLDLLRSKADEIAQALRAANAYKVHDDLGRRTPSLQIDIDQGRANTLAINNSQIGRVAQAAFSGVKVTEMREGDHLIPVMLRLRIEERNEAEKIRTLYVRSERGSLA
ncbi:MAG: efflux RND transporter permease subunit, partial [Magnetococcus sp. WYHC-3]